LFKLKRGRKLEKIKENYSYLLIGFDFFSSLFSEIIMY